MKVTKQDMALIPSLYPFTSPEAIPLTFSCGNEVIHGIPKEFHPKVTRFPSDRSAKLTVIEGTRDDGLTIRAECTQYRDAPVVEWIAFLSNHGKKDTPRVSDFQILEGSFAGKNPILQHARGEGILNENPLPDGLFAGEYPVNQGDTPELINYKQWEDPLTEDVDLFPDLRLGHASMDAAPYTRLFFRDGNEKPYSVALAIGWSGTWRAVFRPKDDHVEVRIGQYYFDTVIHPGETLRSPRITLAACDGGERDRARNLWRTWYYHHILPRDKDGKPFPPQLIRTDHAKRGDCFSGTDYDSQVKSLNKYLFSDMKPDIWWIDAGWYYCGGQWPDTVGHWVECVGTWREDDARFPDGMSALGKKCENLGIRFLLWFDPERVRAGSELFTEHHEWVLTDRIMDGKHVVYDNCLLNLADEDALAWITDRLDRDIKEYHIGVYRQDCNIGPAPFWRAAETEDRVGAVENHHIQNYYRLWDELRRRNPDLIIDSCAGGGRRNDLETMRRSVPLHYTDYGYGNHPVRQVQAEYLNEWTPYYRVHTISWDNEEGTYSPAGKHEVERFSFLAAIAPALGDTTHHNAPGDSLADAREMDKVWRMAAPLMLSGDFYPMTVCRNSAEDWYAVQFEDTENRKGFVQIVRNVRVKESTYTAPLRVTTDNAVYVFENYQTGETRSLTSDSLRHGFTVMLDAREAAVWMYTIEKQ